MKGKSDLTIGSWLVCVNQFIDASTRFLSTREAFQNLMASLHHQHASIGFWTTLMTQPNCTVENVWLSCYICDKTNQNTLLPPSYHTRDLCTSCANEQGSDENHPIKNCFCQRCKTSAWSLVNQNPCLQWGKPLVTSHKSSSELST